MKLKQRTSHSFAFRIVSCALFVSLFYILYSAFYIQPIFAQSCQDTSCDKDGDQAQYLHCIEEKQSCWEQKISEARSQRVTLANTISILENKIYLQELQIEQTQTELRQLEKEVEELSERLSGLEISLDGLSKVLVERIQEDYKRSRSNVAPIISIIPQSASVSDVLSQWHYLRRTQEHITELMQQAETQRLDYDQQKQLKEEKQAEVAAKEAKLQAQQAELDNQKRAQEVLLVETKHDEARYQQELARIQAEYQAIQAILAGNGEETSVGGVQQGDEIASIIQGSSCNSSGSHLHFMVAKDGATYNPFDYLKGGIDYTNYSGSSANSSDQDSFNPSGSWDWPIQSPIKFNQGYGSTWCVRYGQCGNFYSFHNGIDISSSSSTVRAVSSGELFRGSFTGSGGCRLRYVRVKHNEGDVSSYYLHVNY